MAVIEFVYFGCNINNLKKPGKNEICFRDSSSARGKLLFTPPSRREWAKKQTANIGGDQMNSGKDSPSIKCQRPSRRSDERAEVTKTSCP